MRNRFLVAYDVADGKRLRKTYRAMHGFGDPVQYSLFVCELSAVERQAMVERLTQLLNLREDRVLIVDLGAPDGPRAAGIQVMGKPLDESSDPFEAVVV